MSELLQATPQVKKNLVLIRGLLAVILFCFAFFFIQAHPDQKNLVLGYVLALAATFIPFSFLLEEKFEQVHFQYIVFAMDFVFLLLGLFLFNHFETNLLLMIFLTFFISAISQSIGRSIVVATAVIGIYLYLIYYKDDVFNYMDPILMLSCALLFVVSIHSGYLAYRTVQGERDLIVLAQKANLLSQRVKEGDQIALNYAAILKNVLDTLPIGAIAVSTEASTIFVNSKAGKILDMNPKSITNIYLFTKDSPLGDIGELMSQALKNKRDLKREYLDTNWKGKKKRFRLDSSTGSSLSGQTWGTLFLIQESTITEPLAETPTTT